MGKTTGHTIGKLGSRNVTGFLEISLDCNRSANNASKKATVRKTCSCRFLASETHQEFQGAKIVHTERVRRYRSKGFKAIAFAIDYSSVLD
jgi:hypothetical protein